MKKTLSLIVAFSALAAGVFWPKPIMSHVTTTNTVLFDREIVRILNSHCVMCHARNAVSFPLVTYEETWLQREPMLTRVLAHHMPPWAAIPGNGEFANDNGLTLRETQFVVSWVEGLGPRNSGEVFLNVLGDGARRPAEVRAGTDFDNWKLGEPSLTRPLGATTIEEGAADRIERTVVDLELNRERWIRGLEYMPGDRRVVRAAFFTVQETGQWLGSWTPWHGFVELPEGVAYRLPAGSRVVAEIHYRGTNQQVVEQGTLGLFFAGGALKSPSDLILEASGEVSAGGTAERFRAETRLESDTYAWSLRPEVMPGIQSIEVSARRTDGGTQVLLFAKDIPMGWPTPYIFKEPVLLPAGTQLSVTAYYANGGDTPQPGGVRLTVSRYE